MQRGLATGMPFLSGHRKPACQCRIWMPIPLYQQHRPGGWGSAEQHAKQEGQGERKERERDRE
eukprot:7404232-Alexandrium_andersonii.AAC.1